MYALSLAEIEKVGGADGNGALAACTAVGGAAGGVGAFLGPATGAGAALGGCALGVALYYWG
jgi:hypothetical protein